MKIRGFAAAGQATTPVPTAFLADEMPNAPADYVKVYLYGLYLAGMTAPPAPTEIEERLHMKSSEIEDAFAYWQRRGAVQVREDGTVYYGYGTTLARTEPFPYVAFNLRISEALGRDARADELTRVYGWMETFGFPQEVALMLVTHCIESKGRHVSINYMDKLAAAWAEHGVDTTEKAQMEIDEYRARTSGARQVMLRMGFRDRIPGQTELDLYSKWIHQYGFTHEGIIKAMEGREFNMSSPFKYLDAILSNLNENSAHTAQEIALLQNEGSAERNEVKEALRMLGFQSTPIQREHIETYRTWKAKGYSSDVIMLACAQATRYEHGRMGHATRILESWTKAGLKDEQDIRNVLAAEAAVECQVQEVYAEAGIDRVVRDADTKLYKKYTNECKMQHDVLMFAATLSSVARDPLSYYQSVLRRWADASVTTVDQARRECQRHEALQAQQNAKATKRPTPSYAQRPLVSAAEAEERSARTLQALKERYGTN